MDLFISLVAWVGLSGVIVMSALAPGVGLIMGAALIVGLIDGPSGGRLEARRKGR